MSKRLVIAALAIAAGCSAANAVEVVDSVFQVSFTHDGQQFVYNDNVVPMIPESACYNWFIKLDAATTGEVTAVETFTLPEPLAAWQNYTNDPTAGFQVQPDAMTAVSTLKQVPEDGWVSNGWCAAAGDPLGKHVFVVAVGDAAPLTFEFDVVAPENYNFAASDPAPIAQPRSPFDRSVDNSW